MEFTILAKTIKCFRLLAEIALSNGEKDILGVLIDSFRLLAEIALSNDYRIRVDNCKATKFQTPCGDSTFKLLRAVRD